SVQAWRDEVRPRLEASLGPALASPPAADARDQVVALVQEYLGRYPDSPYRVRVDQLSRRIDPGARARIWDSAELGDNLGDTRYAGLEEVPLRNGGFFYRRPSASDTDPMHRVVDSLAALGEDPDSLGGILLPKEALAGAVRRCDVSDAWRDAERMIATAPVEEIPSIMLGLLQRLKTGNEGDSLFRIRALRDATDVFLRCGHAPASVVAPLREWMDWVRKNADQVTIVDWPRAARDPNDRTLALRRKAFEALQRFPSVEAVARQAVADQRRVGSELAPMAPVGVLLPADSAGARRFEGNAGDGALVVIVRDGVGWRAEDMKVADGALVTQGLEIPQGPVLVFRRSGS
ncbi:MAG: hypothetical protein ACO3IB_13745, partial [Phycisphaerales bacterium]